MLDLYAELRQVAAALDTAGLHYALAGGLAVSIYTTPRATEDIDLLISPADLGQAVTVLGPLGFRRAGPAMRVADGRLDIQRLIKIEGTDLLPLDLLLPHDADLMMLLHDRTSVMVEGHPLWVIGLRALRTLKRLRNSALDQADLHALGDDDS